MHPLLTGLPPAIAQALQPYLKPAPDLLQEKQKHDEAYKREASVLRGEKLTDWSAS